MVLTLRTFDCCLNSFLWSCRVGHTAPGLVVMVYPQTDGKHKLLVGDLSRRNASLDFRGNVYLRVTQEKEVPFFIQS